MLGRKQVEISNNCKGNMWLDVGHTSGIVKNSCCCRKRKKTRNTHLEELFVSLLPNVVLGAWVTKLPLAVDNLKSILSLNQ